jgi:protein-S-isoprenylcysteine O-methyltransferase Ste14
MRNVFLVMRTLSYAVLAFLFWRFVAMQAMLYDKNIGFILPRWTELLCIPLLFIGIIFTAICFFEFITVGRGSFVHFDAPKNFVASGLYKYSRNPMYLGVLLIFFGYGFLSGSLSILTLTFLLFLLAHIIVVFVEEPGLENKFGVSYISYKKSIGRWLPKPRSK